MHLKVCFQNFLWFPIHLKCLGIRLGRGEKARGQIVIGTPGTCMDWVVRYKSVDPSLIKVQIHSPHYQVLLQLFNPVDEHCKCGLNLYFGHLK